MRSAADAFEVHEPRMNPTVGQTPGPRRRECLRFGCGQIAGRPELDAGAEPVRRDDSGYQDWREAVKRHRGSTNDEADVDLAL